MLADPRRLRLLIAGGLILFAATLLRLAADTPAPLPTDGAGVEAAAAGPGPEAEQRQPPGETRQPHPEADTAGAEPDVDAAHLDEAHQIAADFATAYLTWHPDETHTQRLDRLTTHTSDDLADQLADARGAAESAGGVHEQTAEVMATHTLTVRQAAVEIAVMTELTGPGQDPIPATLTVVLAPDRGGWVVDDLR